ncbi:MAG: hypothetical protein HY517_00410 [Candidatus Aenigmarchaeota archaeon]|nr:hypothetical protein [Candidatus Aenigmarchaeota archaeon]
MAIYSPRMPIVIASSFEGLVNDGARECALVSFNAYRQQEAELGINEDFILGKVRSAAEFNGA